MIALFHDMEIEELLDLRNKKDLVFIDVRSPSEFKNATIPGSINIPLFDDAERAEVGTIYTQESVQLAKQRGLEIASAKLPAFVKSFHEIEAEKVVFCWRGGMRSKTSSTVLDLMGIHTYRIKGGFRAYRRYVVDALEHFHLEPPAYVLNGFTGSGKTIILRKLLSEGYPVLDFEGMANHRGSIFGQIGLTPHNQKAFDSLLFETLLPLQQAPYVLMEAESQRVGKVVLPRFIMEKKEQGKELFIELPTKERVRNILEDYRPWEYQQQCIDVFQKIKSRIHTPIAALIHADLLAGDFASAVELLLENYYDPRYEYTINQYPENRRIHIQAQNTEEAFLKVREILQKQHA